MMKLNTSKSARLLNIASYMISPPRSLSSRIAFICNKTIMPGTRKIKQAIRDRKESVVRSGQHSIRILPKDAPGHYQLTVSDKYGRIKQNRAVYRIRCGRDENDFRGTTQENKNFKNADLHEIDFSGCSFKGTNCYGAKMQNMNMRGTYLEKTNLDHTDATHTIWKGARMKNMNFIIIRTAGYDLSGVNADEAEITLIPPGFSWNDRYLDPLLNHHYKKNGSALKTLHSLDERYNNIKTEQVRQLKKSLCNAGYTPAKLISVALPMLDILGQPPYINDPELAHWLGSIAEAWLMEHGKDSELPIAAAAMILAFDYNPELMPTLSDSINNYIRTTAKNSNHPALREKGEAVYARYIELSGYVPHVPSASPAA